MYCTLEQVLDFVPTIGQLGDSSVPSFTQATAYLDAICIDIDRHLTGRGVVVPVVAGTSEAALLNPIAIYGAAAVILKAKYPGDSGSGGDKGAAGFWQAKFEAGLSDIDNDMLAPSVATTGGNVEDGFPKPCYEPFYGPCEESWEYYEWPR